jgi:hypothetical protein
MKHIGSALMSSDARLYAKMPEGNPLNIDPLFCDIPPNEIIPGLWIGNFYDGENLKLLNALSIDAVVNLTGSIRVIFPRKIHLVIGLNQPFLHTLDDAKFAVKQIQKLHMLSHLNVLVHCLSGKDRAPTVVAKALGAPKQADLVRERRPNCIIHEDWWGATT